MTELYIADMGSRHLPALSLDVPQFGVTTCLPLSPHLTWNVRVNNSTMTDQLSINNPYPSNPHILHVSDIYFIFSLTSSPYVNPYV